MNITICGARGSIPTTSPDTKEYGGNTSCVQVEADGWVLVLDAGSGLQNVRLDQLPVTNRIDILLTHLHIDHIQGLGFFKPLFNPAAEVHIWGPASNGQSLRARLGRYFSPPLFPVYFRDLTCKLELHEIEDSRFTIGPFEIQSCYVTHPGPTLGLRIQSGNTVLAYLPDHEPALGLTGLIDDLRWLSGADLARNADLLIHDAQYTTEEYQSRIGWGHSSVNDALHYAELTSVKQLLFTHHDPVHGDSKLDEMLHQLKAGNHNSISYRMAMEGMKIAL